MEAARTFWQALLNLTPHKIGARYSEFKLANINLGLLFNEMNDQWTGTNCVPVFEFADQELPYYVELAKSLGANVVFDGLDNPHIQSIVMADLWGNEFELSRFHD